MINERLARKVINKGLSSGADFVELFYEDSINSVIGKKEDDCISTCSADVVSGVGIRILKGVNSVYGYTNDLTSAGLMDLVTKLAAKYNDKRIKKCAPFNKEIISEFPYKKTKVSNSFKVKLINKAYFACKNTSDKISKVLINLIEYNQKVVIINSDGLWKNDWRFRVRLGIQAIAFENGQMEAAFEGPGASMGYEFFDTFSVEEVAKEVANSALVGLRAEPCPSEKMDVVIDNGFGGVIFHEACGHSLEATSVAKNLSVFSGKLGTQIASSLVCAYDDGTILNGWGSSNIDDEGHPTQCNTLIKDGILTSYMVDMANGRRMNTNATGSSRRESYKYEPTSRMTNTFIGNGKSTREEIIAATKYGLYAAKMGGGSVNPLTGEFNFAVSEGYLIKDGKISTPVKGATLVGKGSEILLNIDMVGNNLKRGEGMCGSRSGSIPADVGQPCIRVKNVTVGGTK